LPWHAKGYFEQTIEPSFTKTTKKPRSLIKFAGSKRLRRLRINKENEWILIEFKFDRFIQPRLKFLKLKF
jgi:hypothetical protein